MRAGPLVLIVGAAWCGGCGSAEQRTEAPASTPVTRAAVKKPLKLCHAGGRVRQGRLVVCMRPPNTDGAGRFSILRQGGSTRLAVRRPVWGGSGDPLFGSWEWGAASPDGRTILAQWSAECEIPLAFFVPASGGRPTSVTGRYSRRRPPPNSTALGWTTDGRAIVFVPAEPACGGSEDTGVLLIDVTGERTQIAPVAPMERPKLERSIHPRSVAAIKRELAG